MTPSTSPSSVALMIRPGNVLSPTKMTLLPGGMQSEFGDLELEHGLLGSATWSPVANYSSRRLSALVIQELINPVDRPGIHTRASKLSVVVGVVRHVELFGGLLGAHPTTMQHGGLLP